MAFEPQVVQPKVELVAFTALNGGVLDKYMASDPNPNTSEPEHLIEFAGRACYQSFDKPNPDTRNNKDYLNRTLFRQGHWSIAEHASATLHFTGVSRAFTHELIRHRHLSYSQLSQCFVDETGANIVVPPALRGRESGWLAETEGLLTAIASNLSSHYEGLVAEAMEEGAPRKQAREAARAVLPNMTETRIVVTGNLRAWHEVIQRRTAPDADREMQEVMELARQQLEDVSPVIFGKE